MNQLVTILVSSGGASILGALIAAAAMVSVNRSNAAKLLAEAQQVSQKTALDSVNASNKRLEADCQRCNDRLDAMRRSVEPLIDAMGAIVARVTPVNGHEVQVTMTGLEIATVRTGLQEARRHLS